MDFYHGKVKIPQDRMTKHNKYKIWALNIATLGNNTRETVKFIVTDSGFVQNEDSYSDKSRRTDKNRDE